MDNEQSSTFTEAPMRNAPPPLSDREREIALQAIAARATGTPVEAAYQILAGIEALDVGPEGPLVVLWPKGNGLEAMEDRAAWHKAEMERLLARAGDLQRALDLAKQRAAITRSGCAPEDPDGLAGLPDHPAAQECFAHQRIRAGEPSAQGEADPATRHLSAGEPLQGASDE